MGRGRSSSASTTSTSQADNRIAAGEGAFVVGAGGNYQSWQDLSTTANVTDSSDRSQNFADYSSRSSYTDSSNRSVVNVTGADPGAVRLGEFNAQLLQAVAETQTDGVRAIAQLGTENIRRMGESVTDLYALAGKNTATSWGNTIDASERLLSRVFESADRATDAARVIAGTAINAYQPPENKTADSVRWGLIAAAGVAAVALWRKG